MAHVYFDTSGNGKWITSFIYDPLNDWLYMGWYNSHPELVEELEDSHELDERENSQWVYGQLVDVEDGYEQGEYLDPNKTYGVRLFSDYAGSFSLDSEDQNRLLALISDWIDRNPYTPDEVGYSGTGILASVHPGQPTISWLDHNGFVSKLFGYEDDPGTQPVGLKYVYDHDHNHAYVWPVSGSGAPHHGDQLESLEDMGALILHSPTPSLYGTGYWFPEHHGASNGRDAFDHVASHVGLAAALEEQGIRFKPDGTIDPSSIRMDRTSRQVLTYAVVELDPVPSEYKEKWTNNRRAFIYDPELSTFFVSTDLGGHHAPLWEEAEDAGYALSTNPYDTSTQGFIIEKGGEGVEIYAPYVGLYWFDKPSDPEVIAFSSQLSPNGRVYSLRGGGGDLKLIYKPPAVPKQKVSPDQMQLFTSWALNPREAQQIKVEFVPMPQLDYLDAVADKGPPLIYSQPLNTIFIGATPGYHADLYEGLEDMGLASSRADVWPAYEGRYLEHDAIFGQKAGDVFWYNAPPNELRTELEGLIKNSQNFKYASAWTVTTVPTQGFSADEMHQGRAIAIDPPTHRIWIGSRPGSHAEMYECAWDNDIDIPEYDVRMKHVWYDTNAMDDIDWSFTKWGTPEERAEVQQAITTQFDHTAKIASDWITVPEHINVKLVDVDHIKWGYHGYGYPFVLNYLTGEAWLANEECFHFDLIEAIIEVGETQISGSRMRFSPGVDSAEQRYFYYVNPQDNEGKARLTAALDAAFAHAAKTSAAQVVMVDAEENIEDGLTVLYDPKNDIAYLANNGSWHADVVEYLEEHGQEWTELRTFWHGRVKSGAEGEPAMYWYENYARDWDFMRAKGNEIVAQVELLEDDRDDPELYQYWTQWRVKSAAAMSVEWLNENPGPGGYVRWVYDPTYNHLYLAEGHDMFHVQMIEEALDRYHEDYDYDELWSGYYDSRGSLGYYPGLNDVNAETYPDYDERQLMYKENEEQFLAANQAKLNEIYATIQQQLDEEGEQWDEENESGANLDSFNPQAKTASLPEISQHEEHEFPEQVLGPWKNQRRPFIHVPSLNKIFVGPRGYHHFPVADLIEDEHGANSDDDWQEGLDWSQGYILERGYPAMQLPENQALFNRAGIHELGSVPPEVGQALASHYNVPDYTQGYDKSAANLPDVHMINTEPAWDYGVWGTKDGVRPMLYDDATNKVYVGSHDVFHSDLYEALEDQGITWPQGSWPQEGRLFTDYDQINKQYALRDKPTHIWYGHNPESVPEEVGPHVYEQVTGKPHLGSLPHLEMIETGGGDSKGRPILFDQQENTIYVGSLGSHHYQLTEVLHDNGIDLNAVWNEHRVVEAAFVPYDNGWDFYWYTEPDKDADSLENWIGSQLWEQQGKTAYDSHFGSVSERIPFMYFTDTDELYVGKPGSHHENLFEDQEDNGNPIWKHWAEGNGIQGVYFPSRDSFVYNYARPAPPEVEQRVRDEVSTNSHKTGDWIVTYPSPAFRSHASDSQHLAQIQGITPIFPRVKGSDVCTQDYRFIYDPIKRMIAVEPYNDKWHVNIAEENEMNDPDYLGYVWDDNVEVSSAPPLSYGLPQGVEQAILSLVSQGGGTTTLPPLVGQMGGEAALNLRAMFGSSDILPLPDVVHIEAASWPESAADSEQGAPIIWDYDLGKAYVGPDGMHHFTLVEFLEDEKIYIGNAIYPEAAANSIEIPLAPDREPQFVPGLIHIAKALGKTRVVSLVTGRDIWPAPENRVGSGSSDILPRAWIYNPEDGQLYTGRFHQQIIEEHPELEELYVKDFHSDTAYVPFKTSLVLGLYDLNGTATLYSDFGTTNATQDQMNEGVAKASEAALGFKLGISDADILPVSALTRFDRFNPPSYDGIYDWANDPDGYGPQDENAWKFAWAFNDHRILVWSDGEVGAGDGIWPHYYGIEELEDELGKEYDVGEFTGGYIDVKMANGAPFYTVQLLRNGDKALAPQLLADLGLSPQEATVNVSGNFIYETKTSAFRAAVFGVDGYSDWEREWDKGANYPFFYLSDGSLIVGPDRSEHFDIIDDHPELEKIYNRSGKEGSYAGRVVPHAGLYYLYGDTGKDDNVGEALERYFSPKSFGYEASSTQVHVVEMEPIETLNGPIVALFDPDSDTLYVQQEGQGGQKGSRHYLLADKIEDQFGAVPAKMIAIEIETMNNGTYEAYIMRDHGWTNGIVLDEYGQSIAQGLRQVFGEKLTGVWVAALNVENPGYKIASRLERVHYNDFQGFDDGYTAPLLYDHKNGVLYQGTIADSCHADWFDRLDDEGQGQLADHLSNLYTNGTWGETVDGGYVADNGTYYFIRDTPPANVIPQKIAKRTASRGSYPFAEGPDGTVYVLEDEDAVHFDLADKLLDMGVYDYDKDAANWIFGYLFLDDVRPAMLDLDSDMNHSYQDPDMSDYRRIIEKINADNFIKVGKTADAEGWHVVRVDTSGAVNYYWNSNRYPLILDVDTKTIYMGDFGKHHLDTVESVEDTLGVHIDRRLEAIYKPDTGRASYFTYNWYDYDVPDETELTDLVKPFAVQSKVASEPQVYVIPEKAALDLQKEWWSGRFDTTKNILYYGPQAWHHYNIDEWLEDNIPGIENSTLVYVAWDDPNYDEGDEADQFGKGLTPAQKDWISAQSPYLTKKVAQTVVPVPGEDRPDYFGEDKRWWSAVYHKPTKTLYVGPQSWHHHELVEEMDDQGLPVVNNMNPEGDWIGVAWRAPNASGWVRDFFGAEHDLPEDEQEWIMAQNPYDPYNKMSARSKNNLKQLPSYAGETSAYKGIYHWRDDRGYWWYVDPDDPMPSHSEMFPENENENDPNWSYYFGTKENDPLGIFKKESASYDYDSHDGLSNLFSFVWVNGQLFCDGRSYHYQLVEEYPQVEEAMDNPSIPQAWGQVSPMEDGDLNVEFLSDYLYSFAEQAFEMAEDNGGDDDPDEAYQEEYNRREKQTEPEWNRGIILRDIADRFKRTVYYEGQYIQPRFAKTAQEENLFDRAIQWLKEQGGFSITADLDVADSNAYFCAVAGHEKVVPIEQVNRNVLEEYKNSVLDLLQSDPALMIGAWLSDGLCYFDLSKAFKSLTEAKNFGIQNNQQAIWDGIHNQEIFLGPKTGGSYSDRFLMYQNIIYDPDLHADAYVDYVEPVVAQYHTPGKDVHDYNCNPFIVDGINQYVEPRVVYDANRIEFSAPDAVHHYEIAEKYDFDGDSSWEEDDGGYGTAYIEGDEAVPAYGPLSSKDKARIEREWQKVKHQPYYHYRDDMSRVATKIIEDPSDYSQNYDYVEPDILSFWYDDHSDTIYIGSNGNHHADIIENFEDQGVDLDQGSLYQGLYWPDRGKCEIMDDISPKKVLTKQIKTVLDQWNNTRMAKLATTIHEVSVGNTHGGGVPFVYDNETDTLYYGSGEGFHYELFEEAELPISLDDYLGGSGNYANRYVIGRADEYYMETYDWLANNPGVYNRILRALQSVELATQGNREEEDDWDRVSSANQDEMIDVSDISDTPLDNEYKFFWLREEDKIVMWQTDAYESPHHYDVIEFFEDQGIHLDPARFGQIFKTNMDWQYHGPEELRDRAFALIAKFMRQNRAFAKLQRQ